jgi:hypothetical protein
MCTAFMTVVPATSGLSVKLVVVVAKPAVTDAAAVTVTEQVLAIPEQPPLQPVKVEPAAGVAVRVTTVPVVKGAEHVAPHVMPVGALETVPLPLPDFVTVSEKAGKLNVAVTDVAALIVTVQVPIPTQPPPFQPVKSDPAAGVAVNVTDVPFVNPKAQVAPQAMPAGALETVPDPEPLLFTVRVNDWSAKVAVTLRAALIVTVQVLAVPEQPPPLQPEKVEPAAGAAVRVTAVPDVKEVEQVAPQAMPAGLLVTVPLPAPALVSVRVNDGSAKVAVTEVAPLIVTVQVVAVPEQPPPFQPEKVEPDAGAAVKVTAVPLVKEVEQVVPQEMPAGELVTVPLPAPALVTVRANEACMNVAVTEVAPLIVTVQVVAVPEQPPPFQPEKVEPAAGAAVRVTAVPDVKEVEQVAPQAMPAGLLVMVPVPAPALVSVRLNDGSANVAVTL